MLIAKDLKGKVYVAKVQEPKDRYTPGSVGEWYFIGPGSDAFITWMGGTRYMVVFKYLASNFARIMDISTWPPTQVDPVTSYNPITIQRPESWLPATQKSDNTFHGTGTPTETVSMVREDQYIRYDYNLGTYKITIGRNTGTTPPNVDKYRMYSRDIGTTNWTLEEDWASELRGLTRTYPSRPNKEFCMSWGNLWEEGYQNYPRGSHPVERLKGPILSIPGNSESVVINLEVSDTLSMVSGENGNGAFLGLFTPMPSFMFHTAEDTLSASRTSDAFIGTLDWTYTWERPGDLSDTVTLPSQTLFSTSSMGF